MLVTLFIDIAVALIGPGRTNYITVFGGGDLFAASIGLSAAAAGDLICDRFFQPNPTIEHLRWLGACLGMLLFAAIAYAVAKDYLDLSDLMSEVVTKTSNKADELETTLAGIKNASFWISIASPITCTLSALVAYHSVKRSEP